MKKNDGIPKYRRQKRKSGDLAFVELAGRRHYLGAHGTETSRTEYKRLVAEWLSRGRQLSPGRHEITIAELLVRYLRHAEAYYRRADGTLTNEVENLCLAMRPLRDLYGHTLAVERAVNSEDQPEIIEYCRSLSILSREGAAWEGP